ARVEALMGRERWDGNHGHLFTRHEKSLGGAFRVADHADVHGFDAKTTIIRVSYLQQAHQMLLERSVMRWSKQHPVARQRRTLSQGVLDGAEVTEVSGSGAQPHQTLSGARHSGQ